MIMIPAYNPDEKFIALVKSLKESGYTEIIAINDGSRKDTLHFFTEAREQYHCKIISHSINLGQGRAYKSGFNYFLTKFYGGGYNDVIGIIQCDCDGQHCVEDIDMQNFFERIQTLLSLVSGIFRIKEFLFEAGSEIIVHVLFLMYFAGSILKIPRQD